MSVPTCNICDGPLAPTTHNTDANVAPWECSTCHWAFWPSEVTASAKALWRNDHRDFGFTTERVSIDIGIASDMRKASVRGINTRPEQVALLDKGVLQRILAREGLSNSVRAEIEAAS